jgi:hypothetical protein
VNSGCGTKRNCGAHTAFPELSADRPHHQPGDDSRRLH